MECPHFFNRARGDLVRKNPALLVRDGLPIDAERCFGVFAERVEYPIRICSDTGRGQGQYGTQCGIHTFAGQITKKP